MANSLTTSTQDTVTTAPTAYTNYLNNQATQTNNAVNNAIGNYVGATGLQTNAFTGASDIAPTYQPGIATATNTLNNATSATSPLSAATPYLTQATSDPSKAAAGYVSNYLMPAAQSLEDLSNQGLVYQTLPQANAAAAGAGNFGSRNAGQAIGQTEANANMQTNSQIQNMLNTGYQSALNAALQENQIANTAGSTAAGAAGTGQANQIQAATAQGNLATTAENAKLADINAQATLGAQQQAIEQGKYTYPLDVIAKGSNAMAGNTIPTSTSTSLTMSPLSTAASIGSIAKGALDSGTTAAITAGLNNLLKPNPSNTTTPSTSTSTETPGVYPDSSSASGYADYMGNPVNKDGSPFTQGNQDAINNNTNNDQYGRSQTIVEQVDNGDGTTTYTYADGHSETR